MFGRTFSHDVLSKYVILFGTIFNDIYITRDDSNGVNVQTLKIPLSYGPKEKYLARLDGNPSLSNKIAMTVPRITFEMISFQYDSSRKLNKMNKLQKQGTSADDIMKYQYSPVPYNIQFQLSILVKNAEDGTRIIEQILPYFTPEWTASVNLVPEVDGPRDIPIVLDSINVEDSYEGSFETRRAIIWTLDFTMKAWLYGPTKNGKIIKFAEANILDSDTSNVYATVTAQPGLLANGSPTTDATLTIPYSNIKSTDNYAFINDFIENN